MNSDRLSRFEKALATFPGSARPLLAGLPDHGGKLDHTACQELIKQLGVPMELLMVKLLPLAGAFANVPISGFYVGAVAQTESREDSSQKELYLGANLEFEHQAMNLTIHAEQSAAMNAWHQNGGRLKAVATSETPCGHCRQFLHEFFGGKEISIIQPGNREVECQSKPIAELLPQPFTPTDLDIPFTLMAPAPESHRLKLQNQSYDPLVAAALRAASLAHTPYSGNLAGCALEIRDNRFICGRGMESVAFNPSVSPLQAAIIRMNLMNLKEPQTVERAVLVERPAKIRQKEIAEMLMKTIMPGITLEYHLAQEENE